MTSENWLRLVGFIFVATIATGVPMYYLAKWHGREVTWKVHRYLCLLAALVFLGWSIYGYHLAIGLMKDRGAAIMFVVLGSLPNFALLILFWMLSAISAFVVKRMPSFSQPVAGDQGKN